MATALVIPNSAMLKINWQGPSRNYQNVFGLRWTSNPVIITQTMTDNAFGALKANSSTVALMALLGTNISLLNVTLKDLNTANQPEFVANGAALPGTGVGDTLPLSMAAVVTIRTALSGKSFRGRAYISGWTEAQNDSSGRALAAANTAAVNFVQAIQTVMNTVGFNLAVLSRNSAGRTIPEKIIPAKPGFSTAFTSLQARNTKWESQRRRTGRT